MVGQCAVRGADVSWLLSVVLKGQQPLWRISELTSFFGLVAYLGFLTSCGAGMCKNTYFQNWLL